jgi:hypothetical protein
LALCLDTHNSGRWMYAESMPSECQLSEHTLLLFSLAWGLA